MVGAAWKQDPRGKGITHSRKNKLEYNLFLGIYVDHEIDETADEYVYDSSKGDWAELPDLVIEKIYSYLNHERKYYCSLVCRRWYEAFHYPYAWSTLVIADRYAHLQNC